MSEGPGVPSYVIVSRPLVQAVRELRLLAVACWALGAAAVVAGLVSGPIGRLTTLEVGATVILFGASSGGAIAGLILGRRTGPAILYQQRFDSAPSPPARRHVESPRQTAVRAAGTVVGGGMALILVAAIALATVLTVMGKPRDELWPHLPSETGLLVGGWLLVCGGAARVIAAWFTRWQARRGKVILCPPLRAGTLDHVYYTTSASADAARAPR